MILNNKKNYHQHNRLSNSIDDYDWETVDWHDIIPRLQLFALKKLRGKYWRGSTTNPITGGYEVDDFVFSAISKTISGDRKWNQNISLLHHLAGIISSEINHLAESHDNTIIQYSNEINSNDDYGKSPTLHLYRHPCFKSPIRQLLAEEDLNKLSETINNQDPDLHKIFLLSLNGTNKPQELAKEAGLSVSQINNLKKRLNRIIDQWRVKDLAS